MTTACLPSLGHSETQLHRGRGGVHADGDGSAWGSALREKEGGSPTAGEAETAASAAATQAAWHAIDEEARGGGGAAGLGGANGLQTRVDTVHSATAARSTSTAAAAANWAAWHSAPTARAALESQFG